MAYLNNVMPRISLTTDDLRLLAYVQHMAETAQSDAARRMFLEYMELERRRLEAMPLQARAGAASSAA